MNQVLEDSLGGVSYLHRVSNRMQLATSCITFWCQLFSNGLRCWYKSEVQTRARWQTWCICWDIVPKTRRYVGLSWCGRHSAHLAVVVCCKARCWAWYAFSAGVETLCLPLLHAHVSSFFFSFSVLAEYFASSHDFFFCKLLLAVTFRLPKGKPQRKTCLILRTQGSQTENTPRAQIIWLLSVKYMKCESVWGYLLNAWIETLSFYCKNNNW